MIMSPPTVLVLAIEGRGSAGRTTLAHRLAPMVGGVVIPAGLRR